MMYRVVRRFTDLQDGGRPYEVGSKYPRPGLEVSKARLEELSSSRNKRGVVLIVSDAPEKASSEAREGDKEARTGVSSVEAPEAKEKSRKGRREHA